MKKTAMAVLAAMLAVACNSSGSGSSTTDSSSMRADSTSNTMTDTGVGSSMTDTMQRRDTQNMTDKMQDTGIKK
jgi:uncharacterized protein YidB (DUF937 family)